MKILVADTFEQHGLDALGEMGCTVVYDPALADDVLREAIGRTGCTVLLVRSTRVTAAMLESSTKLALVVRAGAGYNTIDVAAASRHSILVANCPGKNAAAVAELTFALILALDRRIVENVNDLRQGTWNKKEYSSARGLRDRTIGLLGMGRIGKAVARRARAFSMNVAAWSRSLTEAEAEKLDVIRCATPAGVADRCDVLSIHLAAAPETQKVVNAEILGRLRAGSYVINTARAEVLDYEALIAAIEDRGLRVGLDVFPDEPGAGTGAFRSAVIGAGGVVYGTHHIGASTEQAQEAIADEAVRIIRVFRATGEVVNCVNVRRDAPASYALHVRHHNKPGVLAHVLHALSAAGINVEEMKNVICQGAEAACAHIKTSAPLEESALRELQRGHQHILGVTQTRVPD